MLPPFKSQISFGARAASNGTMPIQPNQTVIYLERDTTSQSGRLTLLMAAATSTNFEPLRTGFADGDPSIDCTGMAPNGWRKNDGYAYLCAI